MAGTIRLATEADSASIQRIYRAAIEHEATSFETEVPSVEDLSQRIATTLVRTPWLAYDEQGEVLGYAYASRHRDRAAYQWSVEVSAYVDRRAHRRGIGRALYRTLFRILALQGFHRAYAGITLPNGASVGLHVAVGFTPVGVYRGVGFKHGAWHDVAWYERDLQPTRLAPAGPPTPLSALAGTAELTAALDQTLRP
jgi:phosphinothricin acetyltransferase